MNQNQTDFGFERVSPTEKTRRVGEVFSSVASRYDLMNDLMSLGLHRLWKRFAITLSGVHPGQRVLDLAGGTGDMALHYQKRTGDTGQVLVSDINFEMLNEGRDKFLNNGVIEGLGYVQANAENLPFVDNYFDCINIGFGLRNVTDKQVALNSMFKKLKFGGCLIILEFSKMAIPALQEIYDQYSFKLIPWLGKIVAGDEASYRYLVESIRMHPNQETLKTMIETAGFSNVDYFNLTGGIVAVHRGYKL